MKIKNTALAIAVVFLGACFLIGGKVHALGSGAGTQSTVTTSTALSNVNSATTISDLQTAVQSFLNQYSVTFSTAQLPGGAPENSAFTWNALGSGDFSSTKNFSIEFIEEWSKYTPTWVTASNLQTVYAVNSLHLPSAGVSSIRCASYGSTSNFMVYDVNCSGAEPGMRHNIHHEYAHYLLTEHFGSPVLDAATWQTYNPAGFTYGSGGASTYGNTGWVNSEHPQNGFVTSYALTAKEEDQADVYAYLFDTPNYLSLTGWLAGDSNLTSKVNRFKTFIATVDASMNNAYFQTIYDYAKDNTTQISVPFAGPGRQYYTPDGDNSLVWVIDAGTSITSGIGIGTDPPRKQTLILDGSITGGVMPLVEVFNTGMLMGSGHVDFIQIDAGGILAPGHSPGCMSTGSLVINGIYQAEIGGTTACTAYDQVKVTGPVDITGGTLDTILYNSYKPKAGESYTIIDNDASDAVTGTFAGLPEGTTFTVSGNVFKITYKGGDGNDVVLSVVSAPAVPDTGFGLMSAHPLVSLMGTTLAAVGIFGIAQRTRKAAVRVRRSS